MSHIISDKIYLLKFIEKNVNFILLLGRAITDRYLLLITFLVNFNIKNNVDFTKFIASLRFTFILY